ncbi:hypothetical protein DV096_11350 [Bradymonadaceae bacterium TMQ3]|uniref:Uncharacterized protein n=1 Tax=Lujinxingia sediminis TaxID=2480984 RepID=A0ABY0CS45_9DELT|nr:hypothetical protein [Lujinxingia sediminis]RDV37710.1 hypothetical protein DV096_11350 [Bradymonadaceae bacterium TMQ3]RVU43117.1 hypothetical protein EA187_12950 [Lujinxingia sediminis]TXC75507.1 hypothetical protein FRC91_12405 [Bradymonadales bacterium TMQ1]
MFKFPMPPRPRPLPEGERPKLQKLFGSYANGTLALMGVAAGVIALATLGLEIFFESPLTAALGLPIPYMSMPLGLGTVVLGGLMARASWKLALPALLMGAAYWVMVALA